MIYLLSDFILYMDNSVIERIENKFINIYNKFDILDEKLNYYHINSINK